MHTLVQATIIAAAFEAAAVNHANASDVEGNHRDSLATFPTTIKGLCAFVTPVDPTAVTVLFRSSGGCRIAIGGGGDSGVECVVKPQRPHKHERIAEIEKRIAAKAAGRAKAEAKRPPWLPVHLNQFPQRGSTLDQYTMVNDLPEKLQEQISTSYCSTKFGVRAGKKIAAALKRIWEKYPVSLRVKELFETVETFVSISRQIAYIRSLAFESRNPTANSGGGVGTNFDGDGGCLGVDHIFDLACGHGLLGVLLAYRFPNTTVVCVDREYRECFAHYIEAFNAPETIGAETLTNVQFVQRDMAEIRIPPHSFLACVHGCSEANTIAMALAKEANAGQVL
jgi:hypothetical protein